MDISSEHALKERKCAGACRARARSGRALIGCEAGGAERTRASELASDRSATSQPQAALS